jgi:hypothetical protein
MSAHRCTAHLAYRTMADIGPARRCGNPAVTERGFCRRHDPATAPKRDAKGRILPKVEPKPQIVAECWTCAEHVTGLKHPGYAPRNPNPCYLVDGRKDPTHWIPKPLGSNGADRHNAMGHDVRDVRMWHDRCENHTDSHGKPIPCPGHEGREVAR